MSVLRFAFWLALSVWFAPDFRAARVKTATPCPRRATGQFEISDGRSPEEIAAVIARLGYELVWKDWDAALTAP